MGKKKNAAKFSSLPKKQLRNFVITAVLFFFPEVSCSSIRIDVNKNHHSLKLNYVPEKKEVPNNTKEVLSELFIAEYE